MGVTTSAGQPPAVAPHTVVITGASSGLGRLTAHELARHGHEIVLAARSATTLDEVADECRTLGGRAVAVPTDVRDGDAVRRLADAARDSFGRIDMWVNNAAVMAYGELQDIPDEVRRAVVDTNLGGTMHGCAAALDHFRRSRSGVLVNVASLYAKMTSPYVSPYVASKYAVLGLSEVVRQECGGERGISVCTVLPGALNTPIFDHAANYGTRPVRALAPVSDPRRAARAVARCLTHPRRRQVVGWTHRALSLGHALAPPLYRRLAPRAMDIAAFADGHNEPHPGIVFEPDPASNACFGRWHRLEGLPRLSVDRR